MYSRNNCVSLRNWMNKGIHVLDMRNPVRFFIVLIVFHKSMEMVTYKVGVIYDANDNWESGIWNTSRALNEVVYIPYSIDGNDPFALVKKLNNLSAECLQEVVLITTEEIRTILWGQDQISNSPLIVVANQHLYLSSSKLPFDCWLQNEGFVSIVKKENWKHVFVFYDGYYDDCCIRHLLQRLSSINVSFNNIYHSPDTSTKVNLSAIRNNILYDNVYLAFETRLMLKTIENAISLDLFSKKIRWVLAMDPEYLQTKSFGSLHQAFVVTLNSGLLKKQNNVTDQINRVHEANKLLVQRSLTQNSTNGCQTNWTSAVLYQHYPLKIHSSSKETMRFGEVAYFTYEEGIVAFDGELFENKFRDFGNRILKVTSVPNAPYVMKGTRDNGETYYYGFCYDILEDFAKTFKFRYESVDGDDGLFGNPTDDGLNATGMVGMVMRGEVDIGVAPFAVTATRDRVIDYVIPYQEDGVGILMKRVENEVHKFFRIFLPLHYTTWVAVVIATILASYLLYFAAKLSSNVKQRELEVGHNFWLIIGTVYGQDDGQRPSFEAGRVILGFWWVFTILITASYTANLAAFLTISLAKPPVKNLEELASQTTYKPLIVQETNHHDMFREATTGLYKRIWDLMSEIPKIRTVEEGYELVETGKFALLWDDSQFEYLINNDCGSLEIAQESFHKISLSFIIPEKAPFKEAFDNHMLKMIEAGIIAKFRAKWWRKDKCISSPKTATALETGSLSGIFALYAGILGVVIIAFIIEMFIVYRKWKRGIRGDEAVEMKNQTKV